MAFRCARSRGTQKGLVSMRCVNCTLKLEVCINKETDLSRAKAHCIPNFIRFASIIPPHTQRSPLRNNTPSLDSQNKCRWNKCKFISAPLGVKYLRSLRLQGARALQKSGKAQKQNKIWKTFGDLTATGDHRFSGQRSLLSIYSKANSHRVQYSWSQRWKTEI